MPNAEYDPRSAEPSAELLRALVDESSDLLAVTDRVGTLSWSNRRFTEATGYVAGSLASSLLGLTPPGHAGTATRLALAEMLSAPGRAARELELCRTDGEIIRVAARTRRLDGAMLWVLADITRVHAQAEQARRQGELLATAQEFGRLGIWERDIPSGEGRWDKHVFGFWGLDPASGTPNYGEATERIHPEDRSRMNYLDSTLRAGRYAQRYRVVHPDGTTRWIHSQWEVKNGPHGVPDRALGVMMDDSEAFNAARALVDVNAQLKLAVDLGNVATWRQDLRTERMYYSDTAYEFLGMTPRPEGLSMAEVRALIHPEDIPLVVESAQRALGSATPTDMEARYRRVDGSWRYVQTRRIVERDENGEPIAYMGVAVDMTERTQHLLNTQELARRLEAASQAAGVGIWSATSDPSQADWNAQMFQLFDRCTGPKPPRFGDWLATSVYDDDRDRVAHQMRSFFGGGDGPFETEFRSLTRDGGIRWIVIRAAVDRLQTGDRRLLGVAMDVSDQHRALDALRQASERTVLITRQAGIGTWESRVDGSPERWDEQMFRLRGLSPARGVLSREERMAIVHPDDLPVILDSFAGMPHDQAPAAYEFRVRLPDGQYRWLASRSALVHDDIGRPLRRVGVNWDVTETKNAEQARQQAALAEREIQAKSQFLSRMSHELRTPLNAVLGFTQLLQLEARQGGHDGQAAKLDHIRAAGDHLLSLINDVLDLSALEAGEIRLAMHPVDLGALVVQSLPLVQSLAMQYGVTIETGRTGGVARADPTRLRQILINLLSNAIKYNRRGGSVVVETLSSGAESRLVVRDTGRGLTEEQIGNLFVPFNRFGVEAEGIEGTGIGLTIVQALVEGMNGRIDVSSRPGVGTTFEVSLPVAEVPASSQAGADAPAVPSMPLAPPGARSGTILYIEDNQVNVLLVEELIKSIGGLGIVSEFTGAAGVARAEQLKPDLILVDLQLPDFDGFEVLRRLRDNPATQTIACVALSANAMPEDIERGLAAGFADYWTKPIDFAVFVAALNRLFPGRPAASSPPQRAAAAAGR